jgi:hypothetical protein
MLQHYVSWLEECESVRVAYERWDRAERSDRRLAYAAYLAALDGEEHAARTYAGHVGRVAGLLTMSPRARAVLIRADTGT